MGFKAKDVAELLATIRLTPKAVAEIASEINLSENAVYRWIKLLHKHKVIHVGGWHPATRHKPGTRNIGLRKAYKLGYDVDVLKPARLPRIENHD